MEILHTQYSAQSNVSDEVKSPTQKELVICGRPIMSETRNLFKFFMLSNDDVDHINKLYEKIVDNSVNSIPLTKFVDYFGVRLDDEFTKNFIDYLRAANGNINYYCFIKFILYVSLLSPNLILRNILAFFQKTSKQVGQSSFMLFVNLFGRNYLPQPFLEMLETKFKSNHDVLITLEMVKYSPDYHFITEKLHYFIKHFATAIPVYRKKAIIGRVENSSHHITYFETHFKYIPLKFCQKIEIILHGYDNPNVFHYYMKLKSISTYQFPYLFEHCYCGVRAGSQASSLQYSTYLHNSKRIPKSYYRSSLLNAHCDSSNDFELNGTAQELLLSVDKSCPQKNIQNDLLVKGDNSKNDNKIIINVKNDNSNCIGVAKDDTIKGDLSDDNIKDNYMINTASGSIKIRSNKSGIANKKFLIQHSSRMLFS